MGRLFRSKSCSLRARNSMSLVTSDDEEYEDDGYYGDFNSDDDDDDDDDDSENPSTTPFISPTQNGPDDVASDVDIGWPTDVRHVSHVTFDRFNGFLGIPVELQPDVPRKPPSASASVFGVSAQSMQCSYDQRGNSVPTILLRMQTRLYSEGGLQAWFRELPSGVLDSLTPEQVMHCNTEEECSMLVKLLPCTEAALLDWAINLMADVVQHQHHNKMNARNIAMVFAPNMTQMADPLTALIHAVQVMNFLKTLIVKTLRERDESAGGTFFAECTDSFEKIEEGSNTTDEVVLHEQTIDDGCSCKEAASDDNLLRSSTLERLECDNNENPLSIIRNTKSECGEKYGECTLGRTSSPVMRKRRTLGHSFKEEYDNMEAEGILNRISLRKGMQKIRRHPVFQLSKTVKKSGGG
ncbi:hypothetical protein DH2020_006267 [Rehmannia glutinosa]|uniref:Rho GTPase-activating protein n=1 Tax=Rehmannia glutinosa TaxID=99300 RepID=A0ABR0XIY1_REHGL